MSKENLVGTIQSSHSYVGSRDGTHIRPVCQALYLSGALSCSLSFVYLCVRAHACAHVCVPKSMFAWHVRTEGQEGHQKARDCLESVFVSHHVVPGLEP